MLGTQRVTGGKVVVVTHGPEFVLSPGRITSNTRGHGQERIFTGQIQIGVG